MISDDFRKIRELHVNQGFLDYENPDCYTNMVNELQVHHYKINVMKGVDKFKHKMLGSNWRKWQDDFAWRNIWTDKFVYTSEYDKGAFLWKDKWIKDQYYDLAKALIPYIDMDLEKEIELVHQKNTDLRFFYKKKPPALVYMVACIENNDNETFINWFHKMTSNEKKFDYLK